MGDYDFVVEGLYEGYWRFPMLDNETFGTLSIKKGRITFRTIFKGDNLPTWEPTLNVEGQAFNNKKNRFFFSLYDYFLIL